MFAELLPRAAKGKWYFFSMSIVKRHIRRMLLTGMTSFVLVCTAWGETLASGAGPESGLLPNGGFEAPQNNGKPPFPDATDWSVFGDCADIRVIRESNPNIPMAKQGAQWGILNEPVKANSAGGLISEVVGAAEADTTYLVRMTLGRNPAPAARPIDSLQVMLQVSPDFSVEDWKGQNFESSPLDPHALLEGGNTVQHEVRITVDGEANGQPMTGQQLRLVLRVESDAQPKDEQILVDAVSVFKVVE